MAGACREADRSAVRNADVIDALVATAREFAEQELRPVALAYDESEEFPQRELERAAALGLTCYDLPTEYGGGGVTSLADSVRVIEELTWGDSPITMVISQGGFFAWPVLALGTEEQKQRWLPPLCGPTPPKVAVAITEPGAGSVADRAVVFATVSPGTRSKGITAFVMEYGDEGFRRGERLPKMGSRCFPAGELHFEDCFVPEDRRLGEEGQGFVGLMWVFDRARVQVAANSLGIGRAALEHAVEHAKQREAFGKPIHEYQAVSFRLADAKLKLDQARLLTQHAARLCDEGKPFATEAAMAKLAASEAGFFATWAASQTLGGAGYVRDSPVQKWLRDAKLDEIWDGTSDIMRLIVARSLFR